MSKRGRRVCRRGGKTKSGAFDSINITPFTDVLLVLLIIFMIAGSALAPTGVGMTNLGAASAQESSPPSEGELVLELAADGRVRGLREGQTLSWEQIEELSNSTPVVLSAEASTKTQEIVKTFDRLLSLGFREITWGPPREVTDEI